MRQYYVYILCSERNGTLYIGATQNLPRRIYEHQQGLIIGFTQDHKVRILVHVEEYSTMPQALARERKLKHWKRDWKISLIEEHNPNWNDLSGMLIQGFY